MEDLEVLEQALGIMRPVAGGYSTRSAVRIFKNGEKDRIVRDFIVKHSKTIISPKELLDESDERWSYPDYWPVHVFPPLRLSMSFYLELEKENKIYNDMGVRTVCGWPFIVAPFHEEIRPIVKPDVNPARIIYN